MNALCTSSLAGIFSTLDRTDLYPTIRPDNTVENHNLFKHFFTVDISNEDNIEVPVFGRNIIEGYLRTKSMVAANNAVKKVVIPLFSNCSPITRRTSDSIITEFFFKTIFTNRLKKVTTNKGEVYYGNRGIILDSSFNILFLGTLTCKKLDEDSTTLYCYTKSFIHISPKVFLNKTGLLEKAILNKIIPYYLTTPIGVYNRNAGFAVNSGVCKPKILVEDINLVSSPKPPKIDTYSDDAMNELIMENIDDLLVDLYTS